ncbi:ATP-binding cassette domain-containing protein [Burkholderia glumae]|uniref:ATP-binding cassette domain-containing protein n=1 Tax=Burkholderia glumae TaxID=337 RepID=UPI002151E66A|nr:ATP-binding cassette domain-containing protein [Burkholderia glumae]
MQNAAAPPRSRLTGRIAGELARAVWRHRRPTVLAFSLLVAARLAIVLIPLVLKQIVDELGRDTSRALFPVFLVLAYALLRFLGDALNEARDVVFSGVAQHTVADFTERTFAHLHRMGARFHARRETGGIVRDVQKGADGIGFLLGTALFAIVPTLLEIAAIAAIMVRGYPRAFLFVLVATFAGYAAWTLVFTRRRVAYQRAVNRIEAQSDGRLVDSLLNYDTVKYFATEPTETRRLRDLLDQWIAARLANQRALSALHVGQSAVIALGIAAIMLLAAQRVVAGALSVGDLILVNAYLIQACAPLNALCFVFRETNDALVNVERMFAILDTQGRVGEDLDHPAARALVVGAGHIEFDAVEFGYEPARPILRGVTFHAYPGRTLAVVGGSGSGKSTLVKLLFRLYQPGAGAIRIDGQDLGGVTQHSLREAIGIVPQDTVLFNETIAYNIAYGRASATRAEVVRAARAAQLDAFVERLPDHYDTRVGERGVRLSGGERQRIAIARAILKDPRIIVFDEATSALDTRTERAIQTELARLAEGRTSIVVAHRLSTVVDADWILVMEHGSVVEQGTHRELLARDGVYARMWSLQWQQGELEHAQRRLTAQSVSIAALAAGVIDALHDELAARRASMCAELGERDLRVTGDPGVLLPLVAELCRTELARARPGERITLRVARHQNHAWVSVHGMDERPAELSQALAQWLEGALTAAGGHFTLTPLNGRLAYVAMLPLRPLADGEPDASRPAAAGEPLLHGCRVLAVDDQEAARDALEAVLLAHGARVKLAAAGDEVLGWLEQAGAADWPQVLLCDIVLAGEDGYEVLRRVRALEDARELPADARLPAIALTGHLDEQDRMRSQQAGFAVHLSKPVEPARLIAEIAALAKGADRLRN